MPSTSPPHRVAPLVAAALAALAALAARAAPAAADDGFRWRGSIETGVAGRFGGVRIDAARENPGVLLAFGGEAEGVRAQGLGQAARLRVRIFTGGENELYAPSDGEAEAAYALGRPELRFVVGRVEAARQPALAVDVLAQLSTLPGFEGVVALAGDMRLRYLLAPVEGMYVRYHGAAHIQADAPAPTESNRLSWATAASLGWSVLLPADVLVSAQGRLLKAWKEPDLLAAAEGGLGWQILDRTTTFGLSLRWTGYTRRGLEPDTSERASEVLLLAKAALAL